MELVPCDDKSPSNSGTSLSDARASRGAPEGSVEDNVEEYVQPGCKVGSRISCLKSGSARRRPVDTLREEFVAVLWAVEGLAFLFDLRLFAFWKLDVHHNARSSATDEAFELLKLLTEGVAEWSERSFAIRSLRSPTFSAPASVQDRSAENIMNNKQKPWSGPMKTTKKSRKRRNRRRNSRSGIIQMERG